MFWSVKSSADGVDLFQIRFPDSCTDGNSAYWFGGGGVLTLVVLERPRFACINVLALPGRGSSGAKPPMLDSLAWLLKWRRREDAWAASPDSGSVGMALLLSPLPWDSNDGKRCSSLVGRQASM